jgi:hypothetical protein
MPALPLFHSSTLPFFHPGYGAILGGPDSGSSLRMGDSTSTSSVVIRPLIMRDTPETASRTDIALALGTPLGDASWSLF